MLNKLTCALILSMMPVAAQAYVGPGAGLGAIAVTVAAVLGLLLLVVGFLWFPIKRMLRKRSGATAQAQPASD